MPFKQTLKSLEFKGKNALRSLLVSGAIRAFQRAAARVATVEEAVALATDFDYLHIKIAPSQIMSEITGFLKLLEERPPKTVLEIGTFKGGTFFLFSRVAASDALLISLDLPLQPNGIGCPEWRGKLCRSFARDRQRVELVRTDSHQPATVSRIQDLLAGRTVDFLFIDGDHSYEGVKTDFELYSPLVTPGGWIAFHDIVPSAAGFACGVPQFWQEVKRTGEAREFVADWKQGAFGIGVVKTSAS